MYYTVLKKKYNVLYCTNRWQIMTVSHTQICARILRNLYHTFIPCTVERHKTDFNRLLKCMSFNLVNQATWDVNDESFKQKKTSVKWG